MKVEEAIGFVVEGKRVWLSINPLHSLHVRKLSSDEAQVFEKIHGYLFIQKIPMKKLPKYLQKHLNSGGKLWVE